LRRLSDAVSLAFAGAASLAVACAVEDDTRVFGAQGGQGGGSGAGSGGTSGGSVAAASGSGGEPFAAGGTAGSPDDELGGDAGAAGSDAETPAELICVPDQPSCDGNRATSCNADGTAYEPGGTRCSSAQSCADGVCINHECEPGATFCSQQNVHECSDDGLSSTQLDACNASEFCDPSTVTCTAGHCAAGEPACDGARATTCNADGSGYESGGEECAGDTTCEAGECVELVCTPGTDFCQNQELKECADDGLGSAVVDTCTSSEYCDETASACMPRLCTPGATECSGNESRTCNALGSDYTTTACGTSQYCDPASGECEATGGGSIWANWPMPNPPSSGMPNPQDYDTSIPGVVIDRVTGLLWQRELSASAYTRTGAQAYCDQLTLADSSEWKLPTRIELVSITDFSRTMPAIDGNAFPGTPSDRFWSSSTSTGGSAWYVDFELGYSNSAGVTSGYRVRCVR
jgi:hypothetical protein